MATIGLAMMCAVCLVLLGDLRDAVPQAVAVLLIWGSAVVVLKRPERGVSWLLGTALAIRLILVFAPVSLSDDVFRYLWEGHVVMLGGNPYVDPPASAMWDGLGADTIRDSVAHAEIPAIYPPLALWIFGLLGSIAYAPWIIKLTMGLADALIPFAMARILRRRGRSIGPAWLYALHPLGAVEAAGSGHVESLAVLCMVLAFDAWDRRRSGAGWAILGGCIKLLPFCLVPRLWRERPWVVGLGVLVAVGVMFPFLGSSIMTGMDAYIRHWSFNATVFRGIEWVAGSWARPVALGIGLVLSVRALRVYHDPARIALWIGSCFVLLSPTVHPWYLLWAWVPALLCGIRAWTVYATLMPLSYAALASYDPASSTWEEPWWPAPMIAIPFFWALVWEFVYHQNQPGPWSPGKVPRKPPSVSRTPPDLSSLFRP